MISATVKSKHGTDLVIWCVNHWSRQLLREIEYENAEQASAEAQKEIFNSRDVHAFSCVGHQFKTINIQSPLGDMAANIHAPKSIKLTPKFIYWPDVIYFICR